MEFQSLNFEVPKTLNSLIKVIGVGGGGSNAVNYMFNQGIRGVDFIICNTDAQALESSAVPHKVQLGAALTEGRGAGSAPAVGKEAALESIEEIRNILKSDNNKTSMVFITAGMGGGTGTGAAPIIAQLAREMGILTVGIVTVPFGFEGKKRHDHAEDGVLEMRAAVDTLLIIRNDKLRELFGNLSMKQAFGHADEVLCTAAKGIAEVMTLTGLVNVDMNDVKTVMKDSGVAIMGSGRASGEGRAKKAVDLALESPLLNDSDIFGAKHVLLNITHGEEELLMDEVSEITDAIQDRAGMNANVIWGYGQDNRLGNDISVTVIATGWNAKDIDAVLPGLQVAETVVVDIHTSAEEVSAQLEKEVLTPITPTVAEVAKEIIAPIDSPVLVVNLEDAAPLETQEDLRPFQQAEITFEIEYPAEEPKLEVINETLNTIVAESRNTMSSDSEIENVSLKLKEDHTSANVQQDVYKVIGLEDAINAPVASMPIRERATDQVDRASIAEKQMERVERIKQVSVNIKNPAAVKSLEEEPAYMRKKIALDAAPSSNHNPVSRFGMTEIQDENGEKRYELKSNNPFLHDNVD
jgi:cell division protein FtsZ